MDVGRKTTPRNKRLLTALFVVLLLVLISPWLVWIISPRDSITTAVYTKTVPDESMRQHAALMWFLKHEKVPTTEGSLFDRREDYFGYVPPRGDQEGYVRPLSRLPEDTDLLYVTDTYGIYKDPSEQSPGTTNVIYGGVQQQDVQIMREFLNRYRPTTLIAEYNTFAAPTHPHVQSQLYQMFRSRWSGWTGQYMPDLSIGMGVHPTTVRRYEQEHGNSWEYTGAGFLFTEETGRVAVLKMGEHISEGACTFGYTPEGTALLGLEGRTFYNGVFDIIEPLSGAEVLAEYELDVTPAGEALLAEAGIPAVFPAVVSSRTAFHRTYYLAGNYADLPYFPQFHFLSGLPMLMRQAVPDTLSRENSFYWNTYLSLMEQIYHEADRRKQQVLPEMNVEIAQIAGTRMVSRTSGSMLQTYTDGRWQDIFIRGVNIGIALPGSWFTDFPQDLSVYYRWLSRIGEMGSNTIRIYTLLDPEFYKALHIYNRLHAEKPLWLLQEIWPEEEPPGDDYLRDEYRQEFHAEIRYLIDAVHGNGEVPERPGRAFGTYVHDVSPYVLGYLVGRELEPHEVEETDALGEGFSFTGDYLSTVEEATPTEAWLAESCDYTLMYEEQTYGWQHPVAIVNWPTLDPLTHESERDESGVKDNEFNDYISVNINHIREEERMKGGLFGAYHIYPNYPDFMNNEPSYDAYHDESGRFRYGGYLQEFMEIHERYPAVIAEFGLATGTGNAHYSPDGYHHGSMSEVQQGEGIIRMYETMKREGYAGGIIFEWMDEWAKKTWTTEPYMIPYDRQILWHNTIDPEQNYGILAVEAVKPARAGASLEAEGVLASAELRLDASFLHIDLELTRPLDFSREKLLIGLDTYARQRGELLYSEDLPYRAPSGMEFLLDIKSREDAQIRVIPPYNSNAYRYASYPDLRETGRFEQMRKLINKRRALPDGTPIPARYEEAGRLPHGSLEDSTHLWESEGTSVSLRIPWGRINVADPSSAGVLDDPGLYYSDPLRDILETSTSEAVHVSMILVEKDSGTLLSALPVQGSGQVLELPWKPWNQPVYNERLKESYVLLQEYFHDEREAGRSL